MKRTVANNAPIKNHAQTSVTGIKSIDFSEVTLIDSEAISAALGDIFEAVNALSSAAKLSDSLAIIICLTKNAPTTEKIAVGKNIFNFEKLCLGEITIDLFETL